MNQIYLDMHFKTRKTKTIGATPRSSAGGVPDQHLGRSLGDRVWGSMFGRCMTCEDLELKVLGLELGV